MNILYVQRLIAKSSPMYYNILDLTGRHQPSKKSLGTYFDVLRLLMARELRSEEYKLSADEQKQFVGRVQLYYCQADNHVWLMSIILATPKRRRGSSTNDQNMVRLYISRLGEHSLSYSHRLVTKAFLFCLSLLLLQFHYPTSQRVRVVQTSTQMLPLREIIKKYSHKTINDSTLQFVYLQCLEL